MGEAFFIDVSILLCQVILSNSACTGIFLQFWEGALGRFRLGKIAWKTPKLGNLCHFYQLKNKLAITHTIAIKLKENITM